MKTCVEYRDVSREDGSTYRRCAKFEDSDTAMVPAGDNDMGRRHSGLKFGLVVPQPLRGVLGVSKIPLVSIAAGGGASIAGMWVMKNYGHKVPAIGTYLGQYWPISGALLGAAASAYPLLKTKGRNAMMGGIIAAAVTGAIAFGLKQFGFFSGLRRRSYGLLSSQRIGQLPAVAQMTSVPGAVQMKADVTAWGSAY
jgi:hypothetical protein